MDWGESVEEGLGGQDKDGVRRWGRCGDDDFGESLERPRGRRWEGGGEKRAVKEKEWRRISERDGKVERMEGCGAAVWQDRPSRMDWKMVANIWGVRGHQPPMGRGWSRDERWSWPVGWADRGWGDEWFGMGGRGNLLVGCGQGLGEGGVGGGGGGGGGVIIFVWGGGGGGGGGEEKSIGHGLEWTWDGDWRLGQA